jgi:hypothetical protein
MFFDFKEATHFYHSENIRLRNITLTSMTTGYKYVSDTSSAFEAIFYIFKSFCLGSQGTQKAGVGLQGNVRAANLVILECTYAP